MMTEKQKKNKELCEKYPFLIPHNRWTDTIPEDYNYEYIELDALEDGWRIAFGEQLCEELKEALIKTNCLDDYRIIQIKEKWGFLHWYSNTNDEIRRVISKYEEMSKYICKCCGRPATKVSTGWISSYCDVCADKLSRHEHFVDINEFYKKGAD